MPEPGRRAGGRHKAGSSGFRYRGKSEWEKHHCGSEMAFSPTQQQIALPDLRPAG
jgi:hypothetical protein